jgi:hypothetical protein
VNAFAQIIAHPGQAISVAGQQLDQPGLAQLGKPGLNHGWRGVIAGRA